MSRNTSTSHLAVVDAALVQAIAAQVTEELRPLLAPAPRQWLTPEEAADYLKVTEQKLADLRYLREGPRFRKVGRLIRYTHADLDAWLDQGTVQTRDSA
ncbi:helix-turn-helix domain-containing protein [Mycobacteroides abscessus]|uniref:helix-turn-helix domain-containing protein n=1 Tax=Mycobacteroides abscessus TaxID=36809 RepID=UPI00092C964D|nr:helix-turn-helix domain-containing protein [Mycobacteroides abscessus]SHO82307.1 DNA binding domain, excisionase family [Mycobacteroides abscessus subsp. abscessus]SHP25049.1 DNA binding domain, excisionase family [Mycobacteroides abscessus subsp. abscessus]SHP73129.1 DNA binding domain, excisionase family [Mycobacteroides abscessus subsp. abscessus]SHQ91554.1 DNA binding domain, excisionase family [Mycobacteroides abscessus subsp. abscessus]SHR00853.1 DNA binding domain, excisionase family